MNVFSFISISYLLDFNVDVHIYIHDSSKIVYDLMVADSTGINAKQKNCFLSQIELRQWNCFITKRKDDVDIRF